MNAHSLDQTIARRKIDIREEVFDTLLAQISSGVWKAGQKIPSENELMAALGVSRLSIREAIQKLAGLNLVKSMQGKGTFVMEYHANDYLKLLAPVVHVSNEEILHFLEYRKIVELGTMKLALDRIEPEDQGCLQEYTDLMEKNIARFSVYAKYDALFHLKLVQTTKNPVLQISFEAVRDLLEKSIHSTLTAAGAGEGISWHRKITLAIKQNKKQQAVKLMDQHLNSTIKAVKESMRDHTRIPGNSAAAE